MSRIAEPKVVVSDGGSGFAKALKKAWPRAKHQRCIFHVFSQVKRYTTSKPKTPAGAELYMLERDLLHLKSHLETERWVRRFLSWMDKYHDFLSQMTMDEVSLMRPTHERILKGQGLLLRLLKEGTMFTYLNVSLLEETVYGPGTRY